MPNQQITPERFFTAINSYQLTEAIKSGVELDVFSFPLQDGHVGRNSNPAANGPTVS